jgi:hypothetical protein
MRKKHKTKRKPKQPSQKGVIPSRYKWDNGAYHRDQEIRFILPWQFLYLCKLMEVTPHEVLDRFMNDLGQESWKRRENDAIRQVLVDYFTLCGYGQKWYTEPEIRQVFRELDAMGSLWPQDAKMKLIDLHAKWRNKYQQYWFKKWYRKPRRKL